MSQQLQLSPVIAGKSAEFSECGRYRYTLHRRWDGEEQVCWVMLNPSTADEVEDDPTIRRCIRFSQRWGYGGLVIVNLFAWRATKPQVIKSLLTNVTEAPSPTGPRNLRAIRGAIDHCAVVVAAWGVSLQPWSTERGRWVRMECEALGKALKCLGRTRDGSPRHPLYVKGTMRLEVFR